MKMSSVYDCFLFLLIALPGLFCFSVIRLSSAQTSTSSVSSTLSKNHTDCPSQWDRFGKKCYRVYNESQNFFDAIFTCKYLFNGSQLLQVLDVQEQQFINQIMSRDRIKSVWLNVVGFVDTNEFLMIDSVNGHQKPLIYTNWEPNEPRFVSDRENCVMIIAGNGPNWMNVRCAPFLLSPRAICERPAFSEEHRLKAHQFNSTNGHTFCGTEEENESLDLPPSRLAHQLAQHLQTNSPLRSPKHNYGWTSVVLVVLTVTLLVSAVALSTFYWICRFNGIGYTLPHPFRRMRDEPLGL